MMAGGTARVEFIGIGVAFNVDEEDVLLLREHTGFVQVVANQTKAREKIR